MAKVRVNQIAKELGIKSKELIAFLQNENIEVKSHASSLDEDLASSIKTKYQKGFSKQVTPIVSDEAVKPKKVKKIEVVEEKVVEEIKEPEKSKSNDEVVKTDISKSNPSNSIRKGFSESLKEKVLQKIKHLRELFPSETDPEAKNSLKNRRVSPLLAIISERKKLEEEKRKLEAEKKKNRELEAKKREKQEKSKSTKKQSNNERKKSDDSSNRPKSNTFTPTSTDDKFGKKGKKGKGKDKDYKSKKKLEEEERLLAKAVSQNKNKKKKKKEEEVIMPIDREIEVFEGMTIIDLAAKMHMKETEIIRDLFIKGVMVTINQALNKDLLEKIVLSYEEFSIKEPDDSKEDEVLEMKLDEMSQDESLLQVRPPVVTIMGHVDHGKTSILDSIRKARVADREAGGITQHIGAYQTEYNKKLITFLDTPGHEAFTAMRSRGAKVTDITILVVAADEGIKPQTIEAINHAKAASVPIIVAINKIDKPDANPDIAKQQLAEHNLIAEDWGGDTTMVLVSAKTGQGLDELLEMILLTAEMEELKANPDKNAQGVIIESQIDKGKGAVATVLIQSGTLKVGHHFVVGSVYGKVRAMFNFSGKNVKVAKPSTPVQVIGYSDIPMAGEIFKVMDTDKIAKAAAEEVRLQEREKQMAASRPTLNLESISEQADAGKIKELNIILKSDVQGSAEALLQSLAKISVDEVDLKILHSGIGDVSEADVSLAAASQAIVIAFNVKADNKSKSLAEKEDVEIREYKIIYKIIEDIESALNGMLEPEYEEVYVGRAEVRAIFKVGKSNIIAGSYVLDGKVIRNAIIKVLRQGQQLHQGKVDTLKRFKDDVKEVNTGYECGISIDKYNDIQESDVFEIYQMQIVR